MRKSVLTFFVCTLMLFSVSFASSFGDVRGEMQSDDGFAQKLGEKLGTCENIALNKDVVSGSAADSDTNFALTDGSLLTEWIAADGDSAEDYWAYIDLGDDAEFDVVYICPAFLAANVRKWSLWVSDQPEQQEWECVFLCDTGLENERAVAVKWAEVIEKRYVKFQVEELAGNGTVMLAQIGVFNTISEEPPDINKDDGVELDVDGLNIFVNKEIGEVSVEVKEQTVDTSVLCIVAIYDGNDKMTAVKSGEINNENTEAINFIFDVLPSSGYLKVFLVSDFEYMMPIGSCVQYAFE